MSLEGRVDDTDWTVTCRTEQTERGVECAVSVEQRGGTGEGFVHRFRHEATFDNERDAMLAGLKEGMIWIRLRAAKAIDL